MPSRRQGFIVRYYLQSGDQTWRISNRMMSELVERKARLPQFSDSIQKLVEISAEARAGHLAVKGVKGTALAFDRDGALDLSDQADAMGAILAQPALRGNVTDIQAVLQSRRWLSAHVWEPPPALVEMLKADLRTESKTDRRRLPELKSLSR